MAEVKKMMAKLRALKEEARGRREIAEIERPRAAERVKTEYGPQR